jgi:hypothetical protein
MEFPLPKRALRRWMRSRKVERTKRWLKNHWSNVTNVDENAKRIADNPKWCNHYHCDCQNLGISFNEERRRASADSRKD